MGWLPFELLGDGFWMLRHREEWGNKEWSGYATKEEEEEEKQKHFWIGRKKDKRTDSKDKKSGD
jgi:hypothetical protein